MYKFALSAVDTAISHYVRDRLAGGFDSDIIQISGEEFDTAVAVGTDPANDKFEADVYAWVAGCRSGIASSNEQAMMEVRGTAKGNYLIVPIKYLATKYVYHSDSPMRRKEFNTYRDAWKYRVAIDAGFLGDIELEYPEEVIYLTDKFDPFMMEAGNTGRLIWNRVDHKQVILPHGEWQCRVTEPSNVKAIRDSLVYVNGEHVEVTCCRTPINLRPGDVIYLAKVSKKKPVLPDEDTGAELESKDYVEYIQIELD